jgi:hypothetical protein
MAHPNSSALSPTYPVVSQLQTRPHSLNILGAESDAAGSISANFGRGFALGTTPAYGTMKPNILFR